MNEVVTPSELARLLKIHVKTVYRLAREGSIAGSKIGRSWRFSRSQILEFINRQQDNRRDERG